MRIYGLDFTSAPKNTKPITLACCEFESTTLILRELQALPSFEAFERFLAQPGPWVAAMDFPFSMPASWLAEMGWPMDWAASVNHIRQLTLKEFCGVIKQYRFGKPAGQKHHFRPIDRIAGACSPMTIDYTPVGRMFYQGVHRLLDAGVTVLPFQLESAMGKNADRVVVEGYPALIARRLAPKQAYKSDTPKLQNIARADARKQMIAGLSAQFLQEDFGFSVDLNGFASALFSDATGDQLDAFFCAIQAAWAYTQKANRWGIPDTESALEGWITDPGL